MDAGSGKLVGMSVLSRQLASESKVINYNGDALPEKEPELFLLSKKVCIRFSLRIQFQNILTNELLMN